MQSTQLQWKLVIILSDKVCIVVIERLMKWEAVYGDQ